MPLTTVFFPGPSKAGFNYRKAIVESVDVEYFIGKGAALTPENNNIADIIIEPTVDETKQPDKGWGEPGSLEWALQYVNSLSEAKDIRKYTFEITGKNIDPEKSTAITRGIAKTLIKEHFDK